MTTVDDVKSIINKLPVWMEEDREMRCCVAELAARAAERPQSDRHQDISGLLESTSIKIA